MTLALDWERYKQLCDSPDAFSRWMLEETSELVGEPLAGALRRAMAGEPIDKPDDHTGAELTDMFSLRLTPEQASAIHARVAEAVDAAQATTRTRSRGLGGFEEAWREYAQYLGAERVR